MDWESAEDVFRIRSLSSLEGEVSSWLSLPSASTTSRHEAFPVSLCEKVLDLSFQASQDQDPEENLAGTKMKASDLMRTIEAPCYPSQGFDLVLGADICYGLRALPFIFRAYKILLASTPDALGLLGYVSRLSLCQLTDNFLQQIRLALGSLYVCKYVQCEHCHLRRDVLLQGSCN